MTPCLICLGTDPPFLPDTPYHPACLEQFFGASIVPKIPLDSLTLPSRVEKITGRMSISGAQPKVMMGLSSDATQLLPVEQGGAYILKPPQTRYDHLPENEHLTMRIAACAGIAVPPCGLFPLSDGALAYLIRRYDRTLDLPASPFRKLHQIDFCQLADKDPDDKYESSAEECAALLRSFIDPPESELRALFRLFAFAYWTGNGDLHLKNLALLEGEDGRLALSPAYDLLCTHIYGQTTLCLSLGDKNDDLEREDFLHFAEHACHIPRPDASLLLDELISHLPTALALLARSAIPNTEIKERYRVLLDKRAVALTRVSS